MNCATLTPKRSQKDSMLLECALTRKPMVSIMVTLCCALMVRVCAWLANLGAYTDRWPTRKNAPG